MASAIYQQVTATGIATAICLDYMQVPFNVSFSVEVQNGTGNFGVQYTLNDPNSTIDVGQGNSTVTWFNDVNVGAGSTTSLSGNYMFPVRAVRLNVASAGAGMALQFSILQGLSA